MESVKGDTTVKHFSVRKTTEVATAERTGAVLGGIMTRTQDIGMVVNCKKTQVLCISPDNGCETTAEVTAQADLIKSTRSMKLLGFMKGEEPNMNEQVKMIAAEFRARFWALIHLRRAGIFGINLFKLYAVFVRHILKCNSVIFHSMLTRGQSNDIEKMQRKVVLLYFGIEDSASTSMED